MDKTELPMKNCKSPWEKEGAAEVAAVDAADGHVAACAEFIQILWLWYYKARSFFSAKNIVFLKTVYLFGTVSKILTTPGLADAADTRVRYARLVRGADGAWGFITNLV